jgi:Transposase domain (DUF772)
LDPEAAVRLMLAGFLLGIVHDRRLMREAQVNLAIRWFTGYALHDELPDHSSLTRIRQRWGAERFRRIFERTVQACVAAKIATGEVIHVDASLIRANVSWEGLAARHIDTVATENAAPAADDCLAKERRQTGRYKKVCVTDPDASMATNARNRRLEPAYKQHAPSMISEVSLSRSMLRPGKQTRDKLSLPASMPPQRLPGRRSRR